MTIKMPIPAFALGVAGLVPFLALGVEVIAPSPIVIGPGPALYALQIYAAVILSFMGGVQWGFAVNRLRGTASGEVWRAYGASVVPALVAWAGVWFAGKTGLLISAGGFVALLAYDLWTIKCGEAPRWYGRLRSLLTSVVVVCLLLVALFGPF